MATAAERAQRHRDRKRRGVVAVTVEVDALVIGALQFKEYLDDETDKAALAEAVQALLSDWSEGVAAEFDADEAAGETPAVSGPSADAVPEAA